MHYVRSSTTKNTYHEKEIHTTHIVIFVRHLISLITYIRYWLGTHRSKSDHYTNHHGFPKKIRSIVKQEMHIPYSYSQIPVSIDSNTSWYSTNVDDITPPTYHTRPYHLKYNSFPSIIYTIHIKTIN